jgi:transcriptional regulator with PAS, ATPase and Fis domain
MGLFPPTFSDKGAMHELAEPQVFLGMPAVICSEAMRQVLELAQKVALTDATILIAGESGSGKEVIARAIHHYSLRCTKPWVDVSCTTLPEHLIESELFGYEKGAFTGADSSKPGMFELAHQGTLFLDEIGELEPKMQVKLLRVMDRTPYYRLGGVKKISADVRILAATNRNLEEAVREHKFRSDLYHRLGQICIKVPPLRVRPDDIGALAGFFLRGQDSRLHFSEDALGALRRYAWPGNVRELRNVVIKAAILAQNSEIRRSDLPLAIQNPASQPELLPPSNLGGMERRMILQVLEQTGGHHQKAAKLLGISRRTLSRKLKLYGTKVDVLTS